VGREQLIRRLHGLAQIGGHTRPTQAGFGSKLASNGKDVILCCAQDDSGLNRACRSLPLFDPDGADDFFEGGDAFSGLLNGVVAKAAHAEAAGEATDLSG